MRSRLSNKTIISQSLSVRFSDNNRDKFRANECALELYRDGINAMLCVLTIIEME